jgi:hypothetical protein
MTCCVICVSLQEHLYKQLLKAKEGEVVRPMQVLSQYITCGVDGFNHCRSTSRVQAAAEGQGLRGCVTDARPLA